MPWATALQRQVLETFVDAGRLRKCVVADDSEFGGDREGLEPEAQGVQVFADSSILLMARVLASVPCRHCGSDIEWGDRSVRYCSDECRKKSAAPRRRKNWKSWASRNPRRRCKHVRCRAMVRLPEERCPEHR